MEQNKKYKKLPYFFRDENKRVPYSFYKRITVNDGTEGKQDGEEVNFEIDYGYNFLLREVIVKATGVNTPIAPEAEKVLKAPVVSVRHIATNKQLQNKPIPSNLFCNSALIDADGNPLRYKATPNPIDIGGAYASKAVSLKTGKIQNELFVFRELVALLVNFGDNTQIGDVPNIIDLVVRGYLIPERAGYNV